MRVYSIFKSIQGESTRAGRPCSFVRVAGCPLRCHYCDTRKACESVGKERDIDDIVREVLKFGEKLVEVTGGEPLAQIGETKILLQRLCDEGCEVLLETSGVFGIEDVMEYARVILDVKTPGSGHSDKICWNNLKIIKDRNHEVKAVVTSWDDFKWAVKVFDEYDLWEKAEVLISAAIGFVEPAQVAQWVRDCGRNARFQLQMHKVLWPESEEER